MELIQAIINDDVEIVEEILKKNIKRDPDNIDLWIKLCLTELQYPFEDYVSALNCIDEIYKICPKNIDAIILEAGIKWHAFGYIEKKLFERIRDIKSGNKSKNAILYFIQSWYYSGNDDYDNEKRCIRQSISLCDQYVYPFEKLGNILYFEGQYEKSKQMYIRALENVRKVYQPHDFYNFTDLAVYVGEFITGTDISSINYNRIRNNVLKEEL